MHLIISIQLHDRLGLISGWVFGGMGHEIFTHTQREREREREREVTEDEFTAISETETIGGSVKGLACKKREREMTGCVPYPNPSPLNLAKNC